jgi:hypothetical protein
LRFTPTTEEEQNAKKSGRKIKQRAANLGHKLFNFFSSFVTDTAKFSKLGSL